VTSTRPSELRADFSIVPAGASRQYYDVKIVAINAASAHVSPQSTLAAAAAAKCRKYAALGPWFTPLVVSAGGLFEKKSAQDFKKLQGLLGEASSRFVTAKIAMSLTRARADSALSISTRTAV